MLRCYRDASWPHVGLQGCRLALVVLLSACHGVPPSANPFVETPITEPPPGARDPYPNLGTVPPRPARPDAAALQAVQTGLIADRSTAGQEGYVTTTGSPGATPELRLPNGPAIADAPPAPPVLPGVRAGSWPAPRQAVGAPAAQANSLRLFEAGPNTGLSDADAERLRQFVQANGQGHLRVTGLGNATLAQARVQAVVDALKQGGVAAGRIQTGLQAEGRGVLVGRTP